MTARRILYVTQDSLVVWHCGRNGMREGNTYPSGDEGFRGFDSYIRETAEQRSLMLVDVIEEEFAPDSIPKLSRGDRRALIERRLKRRFPRTQYRLGIPQSRKPNEAGEQEIVYSAVSNHELLDPWLQIIVRYKTPLSGIHSVPHVAPDLLARIRNITGNALLLTQHQSRKLRQVFLRGGRVKGARLSQSPAVDDEEYGGFVFTEIMRSRRYLERSRLLGGGEQLDVYMVADKETSDRVMAGIENTTPLRIHFIDPRQAAKKIGGIGELSADQHECLYLSQCNRRPPSLSYARRGETQYNHLVRLRQAMIAGALAAAISLSAASGILLADAWYLSERIVSIEGQIARMSETFRREHEKVQPINADSHEMKIAVDTGDFILRNRLPVPWVMQQLGLVMGRYQDVQLSELRWSSDAPASNAEPDRRRGDRPMPVPIPQMAVVSVDLSAWLEPRDGDLRDVFAKIDRFAAELQAQTAFERVTTIEYPLDASPQSSLSGEIAGDSRDDTASFRLRLTINIMPSGIEDESV